MARPAWPVSRQALEDARRMLAWMEDAHTEMDEDVPPWVIAARAAVRHYLEEELDDE